VGSAYSCPAETRLYFGNGMRNSYHEAKYSLDVLRNKIPKTPGWRPEKSKIAYNPAGFIGVELLQVYRQKSAEFREEFWIWLWNLAKAPAWFQEDFRKILVGSEMDDSNNWHDLGHIAAYEADMLANRSVLVVAHSQGNFYANNAASTMDMLTFPVVEKFRMISIGTPSSRVANNGPYFTLMSDGIIRWIPTALAANSTNSFPSPGLFDHDFVSHYLEGVPTGSSIIGSATAIMADLSKPKAAEDKVCWDWFAVLRLRDKESCIAKCSAAKVDLGSFHCPNLCPRFCGCLHGEK